MGFELVLFILVATIAIFSAALMLVSTNAVHSALFLVTNFLCVAFFYLMLNAPFLAMIQITVYAGAIMVLFMFVIMLLGAEKLGGAPGKYGWVAPGAVALTTVFLIVVFVSIVQGNIGLLKAVPVAPQAAFVHAVPGAQAVDVYLDNDKVATNVEFGTATELVKVKAGDHNLLAFPSCTETDPTKCVDPLTSGAAPLTAIAVKIAPETATSYVITGSVIDGLTVISAPIDLSVLDDENNMRFTVVNALPGDAPVTVSELNLSDATKSIALAPALKFGEVAETKVLAKGTYSIGFNRGDERLGTLRQVAFRGKTHEVIVLLAKSVPVVDGAPAKTEPDLLRVDPVIRTAESYGSPQQIGLAMLSDYLLPFEMVSLLLLVALVGAIILTREEGQIRRERKRVVVSHAVRRINTAIAQTSQANQPSLPVVDASVEPSAD